MIPSPLVGEGQGGGINATELDTNRGRPLSIPRAARPVAADCPIRGWSGPDSHQAGFPLTREYVRCPMRVQESRAGSRPSRSTLIWEMPGKCLSGTPIAKVVSEVGRSNHHSTRLTASSSGPMSRTTLDRAHSLADVALVLLLAAAAFALGCQELRAMDVWWHVAPASGSWLIARSPRSTRSRTPRRIGPGSTCNGCSR